MARKKPDRKTSEKVHVPRYTVRVDLIDTDPPIWRRIELNQDFTLDQLHAIVQAVFEWTNSHLHEFSRLGPGQDPTVERFQTPFDLDEEAGRPESSVHLSDVFSNPGDTLHYLYDFGDSWEHGIELEKFDTAPQGMPPVICLGGERAGPPDDCGGAWTYQFMIEAGLDPEHPEHEEAAELIELTFGDYGGFDPARFELVRANLRLAAAVKSGFEWWFVEDNQV